MLRTLPITWLTEPVWLAGILVIGLLYALGVRYSAKVGLAHDLPWWRQVCFVAGLLVVFLALESPLDALVHIYQTAHMAQHILLFFAAAPLLLAGAPIMPIWRAFPIDSRRASLRWLMLHPRPRRLVLLVWRAVGASRAVWFLTVGNFIVWHLPVLYDLTPVNQYVRGLEHLCYLAAGLLFWGQVLPSPPLRPRMGYGEQSLWVAGIALSIQVVPLALILSASPLYAYYATLPRTPAMPTALQDQAAAGALMTLAGGGVISGLFMLLLWLWIEDDRRTEESDEETWRTW
jgi:putative membrane protein